HDELTGLANRSMIVDRLMMALNQAERRKGLLAVVFMDIDGFKPVNDTLGHDVGDELLKGVAERLRSVVRSEDTIARFGGDEFVVLISELRAPEDTGRIGTKLTDAIRQPFEAGGHEVSVTTSVGIAVYPDDGRDADTLMRHADQAMYKSKENGGDQFQLYSISLNHRALEKLEVEMSLRRALDLRQFELHFQPVIRLSTRKVAGFEALLRWDHPARGLLATEDFLPEAERHGMLGPITNYAINEACRQLASWRESVDSHHWVAIDVSPSALIDDDVLSHLAASLQQHQIDPRRLELEIHESYSPAEFDLQSTVLARLRRLGLRATLDHFGDVSGSLGQLRATAFDAVKLSTSLTSDIEESEKSVMTYGVIGIAHGLKLEVASQGVENARQFAVLRQHGCDLYQGPLFSDPLAAKDVPEFIRSSAQRLAPLLGTGQPG
ncbi:MAG: EAL domain-containing protein, partial [Thermoanaerobaculia bacterium]|nr:EAL domain-containing protein [Thermoanaerobaculia bacterium]